MHHKTVNKGMTAFLAVALAAGTSGLPLPSFAEENIASVEYAAGEGDGVTKLTLIAADADDNLATDAPESVVKSQARVQVPVAINYVAKNDGTIEGPSGAAITNFSSYPVHISNIAVTSSGHASLVAHTPTAADEIQLFVTPGIGSQDQFGNYISLGGATPRVPHDWNIDAAVDPAVTGSQLALNGLSGSIGGFDEIAVGQGRVEIGQVAWTIRAGRVAAPVVSAASNLNLISTSGDGEPQSESGSDGDASYAGFENYAQLIEEAQDGSQEEPVVEENDDNVEESVVENVESAVIRRMRALSDEGAVSSPDSDEPRNSLASYCCDGSIRGLAEAAARIEAGDEELAREFEGYIGQTAIVPLNDADENVKAASPANRYMEIRLVGVKADKDEAGNDLAFTFMTTHALPAGYVMNIDATNEGCWAASSMRDALNLTSPEDSNIAVYNMFNSELRAYAKPARKRTRVRHDQYAMLDDVTNDQFWLFSSSELNRSHAPFAFNEEGRAYAFDMSGDAALLNVNAMRDGASLVRCAGNLPVPISHTRWWLRTASTKDDSAFAAVYRDGMSCENDANIAVAVVPCFCL